MESESLAVSLNDAVMLVDSVCEVDRVGDKLPLKVMEADSDGDKESETDSESLPEDDSETDGVVESELDMEEDSDALKESVIVSLHVVE